VSTEKDVAASPKGRRRRVSRFALHPGWIVVAGSCALLVRATVHSGLNTDVFWQLASGNWMLSHHAVIRADVFSYTVRGHPWVSEEWGFQVLLAWMVRHIGNVSYWLVSGGACVMALVASVVRWRRQGAGGLWTAALSIPTAVALFLGLAPRPQDLSYLLFALELLLLTLSRRQRGWLIGLPLLFLLWSNLHGSFVLGLGVLVLELSLAALVAIRAKVTARAGLHEPLEGARERRSHLQVSQPLRVLDASVLLVTCSLATLVNPHGVGLWSYVVRVTGASQLNIIEEWQSPNFHSVIVLIAIALPALAAVAILATGRVRTELLDLVVWVGLFIATLHAIRFAPYLAIAFGGLAAPWELGRRETIHPTWLTWPASVAICLALLAGGHLPAGTLEPGGVPIAATDWLSHRSGRVFSTYAWNDYLISRDIPVFVDGRTDLYFGTGLLGTYVGVSQLTVAPDPVLRHWQVRWVLWPTHSALSNYLAEDPHWHLVHRFKTGEVFERIGAI